MSRPAARYRRRSPPRTRKCRCRRRPTISQVRLSAFRASQRLAHRIDGGRDRLRALLVRRQMLRAAVIGLQPAKFQARRIGDAARERRRILARRDAAALHADVDLDQRAQLDAEILRDARGRIDLLGRVEAQRDRRILRERGKTAQLAITDNLIAHQDVLHAAAHQRFGLADLLHALADRAVRRSAAARSPADLCVLACGRTRTPVERANSAIFAMLRSSASRSTTSAGVSMSATGAPISAGGGFIGLPEKLSRVAYSWPAGLVHRARSAAPKASASIFMSDVPRIRIADIHKSFGPLEVLRGVSFDVHRGSVVSVDRRQRLGQKHAAALREPSRAAELRRDLSSRASRLDRASMRADSAGRARSPRSTRCAANWVSCSSNSICGRT